MAGDIMQDKTVKEALEGVPADAVHNHALMGSFIRARFKLDELTNGLIDAIKTWFPGNIYVIEVLLAAGAHIDGKQQDKIAWREYYVEGCDGIPCSAPIFAAVKYPNVLALLIARGANIHLQGVYPEHENWNFPLHEAIECGPIESVELLIKAAAQVNAKAKWENTPLHRAATRNNLPAVRMLLAHGADPSIVDHLGFTPYKFAQCVARTTDEAEETARRIGCLLNSSQGTGTTRYWPNYGPPPE